jgi:EamA domain-containing membrane protein RarD
MLMDLLGVVGIAVFVYALYNVCKVDRSLCEFGVLGLVLVVLAYVGRYVNIDRWTAVAVVVAAVGFVLLWMFSR